MLIFYIEVKYLTDTHELKNGKSITIGPRSGS